MASYKSSSTTSSSSYMIFHPEKIGVFELIRLCVFRRKLKDCSFVETSSHIGTGKEGSESGEVSANLLVLLTLIIQKFLWLINVPLAALGFIIEFSFNFVSINGGFLGLIFRFLTCSVVIPKRKSEKYRSFIGHIDGRLDLYKTSSFLSYLPHMGGTLQTSNDVKVLDLCSMAAKVAYENEAYVKNAVTQHWKMHFVGFYNCWNAFLDEKGTQAFIFCDKPVDASLIVVSFRGTEPFNARDWITDVDLSWISMGKMGRAHLGFMKAMGLQNETDYLLGWPKNYEGDKDKEGAYYIIRDQLKALLQVHKNAQIIVTGHSLGGALAAIFPSVLMLHEETSILNSIVGVLTYGQPRVGDETFGNFIESQWNQKWLYRVVYRYDVVPRIPFDDPNSNFKHFGSCIYFSNWYKAKVMEEAPNKNYFNPIYLPSKYYNAWKDLITSVFLWKSQGKDFKESFASILFRMAGLLIPGVASHSPRDYVNAARLGKVTISEKEIV